MGATVTYVQVQPALLTWAVDRAGIDQAALVRKFPRFQEWLAGTTGPTMKQLEQFATYTHTALGYLFLDQPPDEPLPIPDFRTVGSAGVARPSPDLLDTIYQCEIRQEWYRQYAEDQGLDPPPFVGACKAEDPVGAVATAIRKALGLDNQVRPKLGSPLSMRGYLVKAIEDLGCLVMINGVVGANTHRRLDPEEFRGFALTDKYAPLIFVNGADSKAAQVFTLVHELAHLWAGDTALSEADVSISEGNHKELWANQVAAEVLVPLEELASLWPGSDLGSLAKVFNVSTLVILKRAFDSNLLDWDAFRESYQTEVAGFEGKKQDTGAGGGDFYNSQICRLGRPFVRAVALDTLEGRTLYGDAYAMLGTAKHETFLELAKKVMA